MTLEYEPKPPMGSSPFHIMEVCRDVCGLCGMTSLQIVDLAEDFCPVILAANKAASKAWADVISSFSQRKAA